MNGGTTMIGDPRLRLHGVIPPLVTPLTDQGDVDARSLARLIGYVLAAGSTGVFVLGSSGEGTSLSDDQRARVLDVARSETAGAATLLAGTLEPSTNRVADLVRQAMKFSVDGLVITAPFYIPPHRNEIDRHFRRLAEMAGQTPVFGYDIPSRVKLKLDGELILELAADGVLAGVKDSSGAELSLRSLVNGRSDRGLDGFSIMTGSEVTVDTAMQLGVDGAVPGLGNVDPAGYVRILALVEAGDLAGARAEQDRLIKLFDIIKAGDRSRVGGASAALGAFKAAVWLLGVIDCPRLAEPAIGLNDAEIAGIRGRMEAAGLL
ncbi:dihydrodipicolinate synthase family protein [Microlunatus parietis]|uniref:4-hydroxy-tetrahydrodipicolinate synthase n=1 Tax=Microlunatus parietis TaxID=682979 RepID=A0A7Y9IDM3_9ACTN|nr:dihydrodipicolinate synthase family protein [Microlunatus parietis]NYE75003.1 4-hydroxy-tetrahydrodipicolinate synthase [Microlunatus parietis]